MYTVIVDPFSSGNSYIKEIKSRNIIPIIVVSKNAEKSSLYNELIKNEENVIFESESFDLCNDILNITKQNNILFILSGAETGVKTADDLCEKLNIFGNIYNLSSTRINKYKMQERIKSCNIKSIKQKLIYSCDVDISDFNFPLVLKPTESAASDGVTFCNNKEEFISNFNLYFNKLNKFGKINNELLVQEFISGNEFVVDTVCLQDKKEIVAMWAYEKILNEEGKFIYSALKLIDKKHKYFDKLRNYSFAIIDSLGIKIGPAHIEIMIDKNEEPVLIEAGSRPHGGKSQEIMLECLGYNQITRTLNLILENDDINEYNPKKYGELVFLISNKNGTFKTFGKEEEFKALDAFTNFYPLLKENDTIEKTVDLLTIPGIAMFSHTDKETVFNSIKKFRELESNESFYQLK